MRTALLTARLAAIIAAIAVLMPHSVLAKRAPERSGLPFQLSRMGSPTSEFEALSPAGLVGGVQRQYGLDSQLLRRYWLRSPSLVQASSAPPRHIAETFLQAHAAELGLNAGAIEPQLALAYEKASPSGTHVRWNQQVNGVPVYRSEIVVKVNQEGRVSSVQNNLRTDVKIATVPSITAQGALAAAKNAIQPTGRDLGEQRAELAIVDARTGARLAWLAQLPVEEPMGDWLVFVDAKTGEVFGIEDRMTYATGSGYVFDPDPRSKLSDSTLVDSGDSNAGIPFPAAYDLVTLQDITFGAGIYSLVGPYVSIIDNESPVVAPVTATHADSFRFQRSPSGFEDVMCYYHLDVNQRYIQGLGFSNINNRVQEVDSHGLSGADNSHYVPSTKRLAFGEGGVDDDEDVDVILHEYGHSIQDNIVPGWGGGQEGAMGEGFGDYWGGSYSLFKFPGFQPMHFFTWDGNGETWNGRPLIDATMHYPEDCCGEVHDSGTLWCSSLIDCWNSLGRTVMDRIVLDHHFALGTSATMADAANQIIQSDIDLYGGAHLSTLVSKFDFWGYINAEDFIPQISHTPLSDREDTTGPYEVLAVVTSAQPLSGDSPMLLWGHGAAVTDSATMTPTANPNEFTGNIPGPGTDSDIVYYLRASDTNGGTAYDPANGPTTPHSFHVGADVTPPVIVHTPITSAPEALWPKSVQATITDNLGVDPASVTVDWTLNSTPKTSFSLTRVGVTDNYTGAFPSTQSEVDPGDVVEYHISAADQATIPNTARHPASGEHSFTISSALGVVLVLDDDDLAKRSGTKEVADAKSGHISTLTASGDAGILSANQISTWLNEFGYVASVEAAGTSDPGTWPSYSFIVSSSGGNIGPVANATYRANLEAYVAAGNKLLVEGGEVGYDAISTPGYPSFAANVLHGATWASDNAGTLLRLRGYHPLTTTPHALPASMPITYVDFGSEDSYAPVAPAYAVYGVTNQAGNVGLSVYDDTPAPQSAQIVVFAFDIKDITDQLVAKHLLENAARFLVAPEGGPNSTIQGRVAVGTSWGGSGITVTVQPGGASTTTNANGQFTISGLYAQTYSVSAALAGYTGTPRIVTVGEGATVGVALTLFASSSANQCNNTAVAIPDNNATGISSNMTIVPSFTVSNVEVSVNITHTYRGDLIAELRHGATNVRLHNRGGGSADNLIATYPPTAVSGPGTLNDFVGQNSAGTWTMFIADLAGQDVGTLNQWCLTLTGATDTTQTVAVGASGVPATFEFAPVWPNPVKGDHATLSFSLPVATHAKIALYDISGRLVRVVADRAYEAGRYVLAWDGRDSRGGALRPGMYLARFQSEAQNVTRRFVVVQ